jgi:hypothetical protein
MAIQRAQSVCVTSDRGVHNRIVVTICGNNTRGRTRVDHLGDLLRLKVAEVFGDLVVGESGDRPDALVVEHPSKFLK